MRTVPEAALDDRGRLLEAISSRLRPLQPETVPDDLLDFIAQGRIVLLGEASHGTHEFYALRADITRRLIAERGFDAVVVEGDWPDALRVNRYVRGLGDDPDADAALGGFRRFPAWMWRNTVVREFCEWLRGHNAGVPRRQHAGFYGMDLYSLFTSIEAVLQYLDRNDPDAARRARARYACFDHFGDTGDGQAYGHAASFGMKPHCEDEVVQQLREMNQRAAADASGMERDEAFFAQQNARLVKNAEAYYRSMFHRRASSWNLRDQHMMETLAALERHLSQAGRAPRLVVWAHNSHLGDARATEMGEQGELNVGQLARERWGHEVMAVGFSTHGGTVTAASDWDAPRECKRVNPGLADSWEAVFHAVGEPAFWLPLRGDAASDPQLAAGRLQRAIGVIYRPDTERHSHYFHVRLPAQFDVMLHLDRTRALEALDPKGPGHGHEPPETFPSGL